MVRRDVVLRAPHRLTNNAERGRLMTEHNIAGAAGGIQGGVRCRVCDALKPSSEYYPKQIRMSGDVGECKECTKARVRRRARNNPAVQEYDRKIARRPKKAASIRAISEAWNEKNPEAYRAHYLLTNAVRDGRIEREPCLFCRAEKVHAHHRDYAKPLGVIWLCPKCHHRLHAYFPETEGENKTAPDTSSEDN